MSSAINNRAQYPPLRRWQAPSKWAAEDSQLAVVLAEAPGTLAQLPPTHTGLKFSLGAPIYHAQNRDGDTGTQLGKGLLSPLESWRWTHIGVLCCSDVFAQTVELSSKLSPSLGQVNGWRKGCPNYTEVFSFAEVHTFPMSWSTSPTSRAMVWQT